MEDAQTSWAEVPSLQGNREGFGRPMGMQGESGVGVAVRGRQKK